MRTRFRLSPLFVGLALASALALLVHRADAEIFFVKQSSTPDGDGPTPTSPFVQTNVNSLDGPPRTGTEPPPPGDSNPPPTGTVPVPPSFVTALIGFGMTGLYGWRRRRGGSRSPR